MNTAEFLARKYGGILLTAEEVASELRVTLKTFQNGVSSGKYPELKPRGVSNYHVARVAEYLDSLHEVKAS